MPVPYDFNSSSRNIPRRPSPGLKRLRFFGVLCVVAAITAVVILVIVPDRKVPAGKVEANAAAVPAAAAATGETPGGNAASKAVGDSADTGKNSSDVSSKSSVGAASAGSIEDGNSGYTKGRELHGDDRSQDQARYKSSQIAGVEEHCRRIAAAASVDEQIRLAGAFLMQEYSAGGEFSAGWHQAGRQLTAAVLRKFQNGDWKNGGVVYKVVSRDNLSRIARRNHTTVEGIKKLNNLNSNMIRIGDRLTIIPGAWKITVSRKARMLNLWRKENNGWRIFAVFDIGIGRKDSTPVGSFVIRHRLRHPKWHGPDGRIFDYKDPENPLGDYFLKLQANNKKSAVSGYGIHGSADDGSVGRSFSSGCIRMRNADVEMLYYLLPERTPVEITD